MIGAELAAYKWYLENVLCLHTSTQAKASEKKKKKKKSGQSKKKKDFLTKDLAPAVLRHIQLRLCNKSQIRSTLPTAAH